jgi:hypothetical protein
MRLAHLAIPVLALAAASVTSDLQAAPPDSAFTGPLLGKPFAARVACVIGGSQPGQGIVHIYDAKGFDVAQSCAFPPTAAGERKIEIKAPWKTGAKVDLASLTFDDKRGPDGRVSEALGGGKYDNKWMNRDFKPKGSLEIMRAVSGVGKLGRVKLTLENGAEKLTGAIDVYSTSDLY